MGLLILEKNELASKYEQVKAMVESFELVHNHDSSRNKSALAESRKREECLKKTIGVKDACIGSVSFLNNLPLPNHIFYFFDPKYFCFLKLRFFISL
jgi:hypothetical protein